MPIFRFENAIWCDRSELDCVSPIRCGALLRSAALYLSASDGPVRTEGFQAFLKEMRGPFAIIFTIADDGKHVLVIEVVCDDRADATRFREYKGV